MRPAGPQYRRRLSSRSAAGLPAQPRPRRSRSASRAICAGARDARGRGVDFDAEPARRRAARRCSRRARSRVDELVAPNTNPIMRAAGPLLLLLGRLRVALLRASFASLMEQVADAIKFFETDIRSAGISEQQANSAKYILCATADDIVQHIPTEDRHVWTQYSMLSRFFGERVGGVRFFEILEHTRSIR